MGAYPRWALIRGGRLFEVGTYSRWALIRGGRLFEVGASSRRAFIRGRRFYIPYLCQGRQILGIFSISSFL